jgi:ABC-type nitrate/sulfonate/bicarbonate transport system permease component
MVRDQSDCAAEPDRHLLGVCDELETAATGKLADFLESVLGFGLAVVIGIPFAVCVANSRPLNLTLYPILIATQSIPKVAVAPIILVWFGLGWNPSS